MPKIVYNACYGGFRLSTAGIRRYAALAGLDLREHEIDLSGGVYFTLNGEYFSSQDIPRNDPHLVQTVEELGAESYGGAANLQLRELPTGTRYRIDEYDGAESVITEDEHNWSVA